MSKAKATTANWDAVPGIYEEWVVTVTYERDPDTKKIIKANIEKVKRVKSCVKISDKEAAVLNEGALSPSAINPHMYFLAENQA